MEVLQTEKTTDEHGNKQIIEKILTEIFLHLIKFSHIFFFGYFSTRTIQLILKRLLLY